MTSNCTQPRLQLTSTTAPGKIFSSRSELASHYKSDWHKYNLKRRELNMPMLTYEDFTIRFEAAMALRNEREGKEKRNGKDHLKDKNALNRKKNIDETGEEKKLTKRQLRKLQRNGKHNSPISSVTKESLQINQSFEKLDLSMKNPEEQEQQEEALGQEDIQPPTIDPNQSLFDNHISPNVEANVEYMYEKYGLFIPDRECLIDLEGIIGYCAEKIKLGHTCLYCQKMFKSWRACQEHMIQTRHTKLKYEAGVDLEEFDVFYDFSKDDAEFLESGIGNFKKKKSAKKQEDQNIELDVVNADNSDDSGEWEDIEEEDIGSQDEDGLYTAFQEEIAHHGFDITPLGELIFPDGRIIGHRGLSRYYKQRLSPGDSRAAVVAAKRANGERLFNGRVHDLYALKREQQYGNEGALQLVKAGLVAGAAQGRSGRGILVNATGFGETRGASFTALSLYRYKAAVNKTRREEFRGRRLQQKTMLPMNKMDKKANRMMNGVSVAHALR